MKYVIVYLPLVYEDIKESKLFYNARLKGLGNEYVNLVKSEFKIIEKKNPLLFEIKYNNTRVFILIIISQLLPIRLRLLCYKI